jgi:hypothetical protein
MTIISPESRVTPVSRASVRVGVGGHADGVRQERCPSGTVSVRNGVRQERCPSGRDGSALLGGSGRRRLERVALVLDLRGTRPQGCLVGAAVVGAEEELAATGEKHANVGARAAAVAAVDSGQRRGGKGCVHGATSSVRLAGAGMVLGLSGIQRAVRAVVDLGVLVGRPRWFSSGSQCRRDGFSLRCALTLRAASDTDVAAVGGDVCINSEAAPAVPGEPERCRSLNA